MKKFAAAAFLLGALHQTAQADFIPFETWQNEDIGLADPANGYSCPNNPLAVGLNCTFAPDKKYVSLPATSSGCTTAGPNSCYDVDTSVTPHRLNYHAELVNEASGKKVNFQLISKDSIDKNHYISIEAEMSASCTPSNGYCHSGLVLYNGEANYRSIAFGILSSLPQMQIKRVTPCEERSLVNASTGTNYLVNPGSRHKLRMDYYGHVPGGKWVYFVDDIVQWITSDSVTTEPPGQNPQCGTNQADNLALVNDPHVGLWFVGDITESNYGQYVEGSVGPISIYTKEYPIQTQFSQTDGLRLTESLWVAQLVSMDSATNNITMAQLFLIDGQQYTIEAYTNNGGVPGTLINSTSYKGAGNGLQYVPLWVPGHFDNMWIVVKGKSAAADIGTTTNGTQPLSAGSFLYTANGGANWAPLARNLTFATYARK